MATKTATITDHCLTHGIDAAALAAMTDLQRRALAVATRTTPVTLTEWGTVLDGLRAHEQTIVDAPDDAWADTGGRQLVLR